ncbi:uncharacterized protein LOC143601227 [Bidens hawaiensis]|uniref:uncharacterized protein LOC143601227 n=1 Tax=Bidens hawaiensis TaxID=980011 RepID=UPI00404A030D
MGKKKKFIDKKKSATFQLISRDSSDPNYSESPSGDRVFVRVDGNSETPFFDDDDGNRIFDDAPDDYSGDEITQKQTTAGRLPGGSSLPDDLRREIVELGFLDDGYNYLAHLREIRVSGGGSSFYQNPKASLNQPPSDVKNTLESYEIDLGKMEWVPRTIEEHAVFMSELKSSAVVNPDTWKDGDGSQNKGKSFRASLWYFLHDCMDVNRIK